MQLRLMPAIAGILGVVVVASTVGCGRAPEEVPQSADERPPSSPGRERVDAAPAGDPSWRAWLSSSGGAPSETELARMRASGEAGARALIAALREGPSDRAQVRRCFLILFLADETTARVAREFALEHAGQYGDMWWLLWCQVLTEQARDSESPGIRARAIRELAWDMRGRPGSYGLIKSELRLPLSGVGRVTEADIGEFLTVVEPWLRSDDQALRGSCCSTVARLGRTRIDAWELFVGLLEDRDEAVRAQAADWLWFVAADDPDVRRDVERLGQSADWCVALTCARVLGRGDAEVPAAVRRRVTEEILRPSSPPDSLSMALRVATELKELTSDEVPAVAALCRSTDTTLRFEAVRALGNAPAGTEEACAVLAGIAADPQADRGDRRAAISALSRHWSSSKEALSALLRATASDSSVVASDARLALAEHGPLDDEDVASYLGGFLRSADRAELAPIVATLCSRAQLPPALAGAVRDVLGRGDRVTCELLIPLLARAGLATAADLHQLSTASPSATDAIVDTALSLVEDVPIVDLLTAVAPDAQRVLVVRIVESDALPMQVRDGLPALLRHDDAQVRLGAAELCAKWAVRDDRTSRALRQVIGDSDAVVRAAAAYGLWKCGDQSPSLLSEIERSLGDRDARSLCIRWLREIGPPAATAAPRLAEIVELDEALENRLAACDAIAALHVESPEVVATLSRALRAGCSSPRAAESLEEGVARTLATMGRSARPAVADLIRIAEDRLQSTLSDAATIRARCEALRALGEIGGLDERQIATVRDLSSSSRIREVRRVAAEVLGRVR